METRSDFIKKWLIYSLLTLLFLLLQSLVLNRLRLFGFTPWLLPLLPAIVGAMEQHTQSLGFALIFGVLCDMAIIGPFPCFFLLCSVLGVLLSFLVGTRLLSAGWLCSLASGFASLLLCNLLWALSVRLSSGAALSALLLHALGASLISLPTVLLLHPVFAFFHGRLHIYD